MLHWRAKLRSIVGLNNLFPIRLGAVVALREHFVGRETRLPIQFALRFADLEVGILLANVEAINKL